MFGAIAARIEQPSAVVIAETFGWARLRECCDHIQHPVQNFIISSRDIQSVLCCKDPRVQEEVKSVDVVVERLLEINAIGPHLSPCLVKNDLPALIFPARRARYLRI